MNRLANRSYGLELMEPGHFEQEHSGCVRDDILDILEDHSTQSCMGGSRNFSQEGGRVRAGGRYFSNS